MEDRQRSPVDARSAACTCRKGAITPDCERHDPGYRRATTARYIDRLPVGWIAAVTAWLAEYRGKL